MPFGRAIWLELASAICLTAAPALGDVHGVAPSGGGLAALDVRVDLARGVVVAGPAEVPIALPHAELGAEADVVVEALDVGQGRHVIHVRVPSRTGGAAWEAVLAAGHAEPLFAGVTGFAEGDPGERTGQAIQVVPSGSMSFVVVGDVREDLGICGQETTLLDPRALYPASLAFRSATVQRLTAERREHAVALEARDHGRALDVPLARLLVARGSSVPDSRGAELTDGDPKTVWRELRPGAGQGEFVVMAAPREVPIARMQFSTSAAEPQGTAAAPRTFYVVTPGAAFEVAVPESAARTPGAAFEVTFPTPIEASCVAIVLGDAYARGLARPDVGLAEVGAYSEFDGPGATLDDVAMRLSTERGAAAAQVLERAGAGALESVAKAYPSLDARGRALAVDVAASHDPCAEAEPILARGLCETSGEAPRRAREKLERCPAAATALAEQVRTDAASRVCLAPMLAALAPEAALAPLADAMASTPDADREARRALRSAFSEALGAAPAGTLASLLRDANRPAAARLEILRAAGDRVAEAQPESTATLDELLAGAPTMRVRYLTLAPLGQLAHAGSGAAAARVVASLSRDADWPVRARAAEVAAGLPSAAGVLLAAVRDPEPRVREAALGALGAPGAPGALSAPGQSPSIDAVHAAATDLGGEGWSFVKAQALGVLDAGPTSEDANRALGAALGDSAASIRRAALKALGHHRASAWKDAIRARLEDSEEDVDVRSEAAGALGGVCDAGAADRLTQLARGLVIPGIDRDAQQIGLGAVAGLAALHPPDLQRRLAPLLADSAPAPARAFARGALATRPACP